MPVDREPVADRLGDRHRDAVDGREVLDGRGLDPIE